MHRCTDQQTGKRPVPVPKVHIATSAIFLTVSSCYQTEATSSKIQSKVTNHPKCLHQHEKGYPCIAQSRCAKEFPGSQSFDWPSHPAPETLHTCSLFCALQIDCSSSYFFPLKTQAPLDSIPTPRMHPCIMQKTSQSHPTTHSRSTDQRMFLHQCNNASRCPPSCK